MRKVADQPTRSRIIFFAQQTDVIAKADQALEQVDRVRSAILHHINVRKPEAAGEKRAFSGWQSVYVAIRIVTHHQSVDQQVTLDRSDRTAHTFIIDREETDSRQQQQARIESGGAVALNEAANLGIEAVCTDICMNISAP